MQENEVTPNFNFIQQVLAKCASVSYEQTQLLPPRPFDHHIELKPDARPFKITPYRYPINKN